MAAVSRWISFPFSCVLWTSYDFYLLTDTEAYLTVVGENFYGAQPWAPIGGFPDRRRLQIVAACVSVVAVVLFVAIFVVCRSWRRERVKKKQAIANAHAVTQWTKKVIIGKHNFYSAVRSVLFFSTFLPRSCPVF